MDLLDRLLGHDRWTTAQLLERCRLGHQTLVATLAYDRQRASLDGFDGSAPHAAVLRRSADHD